MKRVDLKTADIDMRDAFFDRLYCFAKADPKLILLTADMGAQSLNRFKNDLPGQFINMGIAEQNMVSVAAGLTLGGKKVFLYTIIPFATLRCYEQIKVDLCCMNLPVTIIGVGPGLSYASDGPTHHATQDIAVMRVLPEITIFNPCDPLATAACVDLSYKAKGPVYVRIDKAKAPAIYNHGENDFSDGLSQLLAGSRVLIIATGTMVQTALGAARELDNRSISAGVVDLYRIKPLNKNMLLDIIGRYRSVVTLEENSVIGGIGSALAEILSDRGCGVPLKRIALSDTHCFELGSQESLRAFYNLDKDSIVKKIIQYCSVRGRKDGPGD